MTRRPFAQDAVLTAIAVNFRNPSATLIADQVMPRSPVADETFKWMQYPLSEAFNTPDGRVGRTGKVKQLEFSGTEKDSSVDDYGFDVPIPHSDIDAAANQRGRGVGGYNPEATATERVTDTLDSIREVRVAGIVHSSDSYAADRKEVLAGTDRWSDYDNSDPISDIKRAINGTLIYPGSTAVMGHSVWTMLNSHPALVNAVRGNLTTKGMISEEEFVDLFSGEGLKALHVGRAYHNTSKPGQNPTLERAWGNHAAFLHLDPMASVQGGGVTFGITAEYGNRVSGRIDDPDIGLEGGVRIRTGERVKELVIAPEVGFLIENAVA